MRYHRSDNSSWLCKTASYKQNTIVIPSYTLNSFAFSMNIIEPVYSWPFLEYFIMSMYLTWLWRADCAFENLIDVFGRENESTSPECNNILTLCAKKRKTNWLLHRVDAKSKVNIVPMYDCSNVDVVFKSTMTKKMLNEKSSLQVMFSGFVRFKRKCKHWFLYQS